MPKYLLTTSYVHAITTHIHPVPFSGGSTLAVKRDLEQHPHLFPSTQQTVAQLSGSVSPRRPPAIPSQLTQVQRRKSLRSLGYLAVLSLDLDRPTELREHRR